MKKKTLDKNGTQVDLLEAIDFVDVFQAKASRGWHDVMTPRFFSELEVVEWVKKEHFSCFTVYRSKISKREAEFTVVGP